MSPNRLGSQGCVVAPAARGLGRSRCCAHGSRQVAVEAVRCRWLTTPFLLVANCSYSQLRHTNDDLEDQIKAAHEALYDMQVSTPLLHLPSPDGRCPEQPAVAVARLHCGAGVLHHPHLLSACRVPRCARRRLPASRWPPCSGSWRTSERWVLGLTAGGWAAGTACSRWALWPAACGVHGAGQVL